MTCLDLKRSISALFTTGCCSLLIGLSGCGGAEPALFSDHGAGGTPGSGVGTKGSADSACEPLAEICNGIDDDCDSLTDEGCPSSVQWSNVEERAALGDSAGGDYFSDECANDEVLVGIMARMGAWFDQAAGICQKLALKPSNNIPYTYKLEFGSRRELPAHPSQSVANQVLNCPPRTAIVGLRIAEQKPPDDGSATDIVLPRVWLTCAEPYLLERDAALPEIKWQNAVEIGPLSGHYANDTAWSASDTIPEQSITVGLHGRAGSWIDRVGLRVATPIVIAR